MNTPDFLFPLAAIGTIQAIMQMIPFVLLALYAITIEIVLDKHDHTLSLCWWFFFNIIILALSEITWKSWAASTPMADIILYDETAGQLTFSIIAFLFIVGAILLWLLILGIRQIIIEAGGGRWRWAFLRLSPLLPLTWFVFRTLVNGNALVGEAGLINLITR